MKKTTKIRYEVYDVGRMKMGTDEAFMGTFSSLPEMYKFVNDRYHLFEGEIEVKRVVE